MCESARVRLVVVGWFTLVVLVFTCFYFSVVYFSVWLGWVGLCVVGLW